MPLLDRYAIPRGTWVTVGVCLWTPLQAVLAEARWAADLLLQGRVSHRRIRHIDGVTCGWPSAPRSH